MPPSLEQQPISPNRAYNSTPASLWRAEEVVYQFSPVAAKNHASGISFHPGLIALSLDEMSRIFFDARASRWISDTAWHSSISAVTRHPDFAAIVDMGSPAAKFILERMVAGEVHVHWFPALKDITGEDPVPAHERGRVSQMARYWVQWGRAKNFIR
jgi:hypothetical protein